MRASFTPTRSGSRRRPANGFVAGGLLLLALAVPGPAASLTLPPGFVDEPLPFTFDVPTKLAFLPDGRLLVAEKGGIVYVVTGSSREPVWEREEEVLNADDHGLLSIAVDPEFAVNRYLYFLYTCDPDSNGVELDNSDDSFGRLVRYRWNDDDAQGADMSTRTVLMGTSWHDGWPGGSGTHHVDDLAWGADGTLLVSAGEGAHFEEIDAGGLDPGLFLPGRVDPADDIGSFRAQRLESLAGKVLRVDPATGLGLPSNPYFDGDPASARSRVWTYGHRNPFRIEVRPGTGLTDPALGAPGTVVIGDVGHETWEEINVSRAGGENFGWPCFEGPVAYPEFQDATPASCGCPTIGTPENPAWPIGGVASFHHNDPTLSMPPGFRANVISGGVFYRGSGYPAEYRGRYFFGDYGQGWIRTMTLNSLDQRTAVTPFASGAMGPVTFAADPITGDVWYASVWTGTIHHLRYTEPLDAPMPGRGDDLALSAVRPLPARHDAKLELTLPVRSRVEFEVLDLAGRRVWSGGTSDLAAGRSTLRWNLASSAGAAVAPGLYLARVRAGDREWLRRIAVVR